MKFILAIGHAQVEKTIEANLPSHCEIVGVAAYREAVLQKLESAPTTDALLIRDNLQGNLPILKLIHQIRTDYPNCRIVLMTKLREPGDPFLAAVVSYGIWDVILDYKVEINVMIDYLLHPKTFKHVERFQKRVLIDETTPTAQGESSVSSTQKTENPLPETHTPLTEEPAPKIGMRPLRQTGVGEDLKSKVLETPTAHSQMQKVEPAQPLVDLRKEPTLEEIPVFTPANSSLNMEKPSEHSFKIEFEQSDSTRPEPTPVIVFEPQAETNLPDEESLLFGTRNTQLTEMNESLTESKKQKAKIFSRDEPSTIKNSSTRKRGAIATEIKAAPVPMSFIGFKGGVGTSQVAFNLAVTLAQHKNRVLYVELNDHSIPLTYLYNLSTLKHGLEDALLAIHNGRKQEAFNLVTKMKELKQSTREKEMVAMLKPYPETLDFITFSHDFAMRKEDRDHYHPECLQTFLSALLLNEGYQYIVLDINVDSNPILVSEALEASKYIFPVVSQDMRSIAQTVEHLKKHYETGLSLINKTYLLMNRFDQTCFSHQAALKWMNHELPFKVMAAWTVPEQSTIFNKANDHSRPVVLNSAPKPLIQAFETMHNYLKTM